MPITVSLSIHSEVPKPLRLHLRLTELRKLGKILCIDCIKQYFPSVLFWLFTYNLCEEAVHTPHISAYGSVTGLENSPLPSTPLDPTQLLPTPSKPPYPNLFYKFVSTLCLSIYMAFVFFNTANVYHLPNRLDRFCFL